MCIYIYILFFSLYFCFCHEVFLSIAFYHNDFVFQWSQQRLLQKRKKKRTTKNNTHIYKSRFTICSMKKKKHRRSTSKTEVNYEKKKNDKNKNTTIYKFFIETTKKKQTKKRHLSLEQHETCRTARKHRNKYELLHLLAIFFLFLLLIFLPHCDSFANGCGWFHIVNDFLFHEWFYFYFNIPVTLIINRHIINNIDIAQGNQLDEVKRT